jgi:signal transduction histidine kinase
MTGNRAADELLRHPRGAEISFSAPPAAKPRHFQAVKDGRELRTDELPAQRAARGEQVRDFEFSLVFNDGTTRHLLGYGTPLRDEAGRPRGAVHILVDITERRRVEEALQELATTLESKVAERTAQLQHRARQLQKLTLEVSQTEDRERKRMAEILHDDLQQIIAGAKFHLGLLRNRVKYDASLQAIALQIDQMLKDAVEKSRGLSHELSPAVLRHGDLPETLDWLAKQAQAKHGLVVHVHAQGQIVLQSDAIQAFLYKAAQELLFNAVKHARVKEARIRVRRHGSCVCLSVSDRGRGFSPQELRQAAGYGLLSIRERIELLGGRMKIKSAPGRGSTFFIVVPDGTESQDSVGVGRAPKRDESRLGSPPCAYPTSDEATSGGQRLGGHGGPPLRVLLADDHRIVREGLRLLLRDETDVEIVGEAAHGREAVDLALRLEPDVVIMDVSMPLIDGDEATHQIKEHLPTTRVIALSTHNEPQTIEKMYQAGAESYVLKTASSEELLAALRGKEPTS